MKAAFTLLELIVTVAIIGILAALLLSGVNLIQARGEAAQCAANLQQLANANVAYAAEHDGQYASAQDASNTRRWHGVRADVGSKFNPKEGPLAPYLGAEARVKFCPTFRRALIDDDASFNEDGSGGYGYNAVYVGGTPGDAFTAERLANVAQPTQTVMFTDSGLPNAKGVQEYPFAEPFQWVDYAGRLRGKLSPSVHFRHGGASSPGHADAAHFACQRWTPRVSSRLPCTHFPAPSAMLSSPSKVLRNCNPPWIAPRS
jgi:prepilin-type N-terminal cleavage/methylation domain-containing protein